MKAVLLVCCLLFAAVTVTAQSLSAGLTYSYLYAPQLDKQIRVYNFSRPFLETRQPLLTHGVNADVSFVFSSSRRFKSGIGVAYTFTGSKAVNLNYINKFNLHIVNVKYIIQLNRSIEENRLSTELHIGIVNSALYRRVNGVVFAMDEDPVESFGIGGQVDVKLSYQVPFGKHHQLAPYIMAGIAPYIYAPRNEGVINATQGMVTASHLNMYTLRLGVVYVLALNKEPENDKN